MTILLRKFPFNLLDPFDEPAPTAWDGPHVGLRIVDAFKTLAQLPNRDRRGVRAAWPQYMHEFDDLVGQQQQGELERAQVVQNETRTQPTAAEIAHMEQALYWPAQYLRAYPELREAVNALALAHALGRGAGWVTKKRGGFADSWRDRHGRGCEVIAAGLVADRVTVF